MASMGSSVPVAAINFRRRLGRLSNRCTGALREIAERNTSHGPTAIIDLTAPAIRIMRHLTEFALTEWLTLVPIQHALKQARNDAWLAVYKTIRPKQLRGFLEDNKHLADKNIALVIAFEQPWALDWLLRMANRNLS